MWWIGDKAQQMIEVPEEQQSDRHTQMVPILFAGGKLGAATLIVHQLLAALQAMQKIGKGLVKCLGGHIVQGFSQLGVLRDGCDTKLGFQVVALHPILHAALEGERSFSAPRS